MIKVYIPNKSKQSIGGGWTFLRNLKKGLKGRVEFTDHWQACDIVFIMGVTVIDLEELRQAQEHGKKIILRVDNVPRKSRNRGLRPNPAERLKIIAQMADIVIYQSEWSKRYAGPLCGSGEVIYNGVDTDIFHDTENPDQERKNRYLYAYHSRGNELKQFWLAHYYFQLEARKNPQAEFWIINNFGAEWPDLLNANLDFWNGEKWKYLGVVEDSGLMADIMRKCQFLIFPSTVEACPNTVLEARACGMKVLYPASSLVSGTEELLKDDLDISLSRMSDEYYSLFQLINSPDYDVGN